MIWRRSGFETTAPIIACNPHPFSPNESERLAAFRRYDILDAPAEADFTLLRHALVCAEAKIPTPVSLNHLSTTQACFS
jgi:hypothetical protein